MVSLVDTFSRSLKINKIFFDTTNIRRNLIFYSLAQLGISFLVLLFFLLTIRILFINLLFIIMGCTTFLGIRVVLDCYVGWKWKKLNLIQPELDDWVLVHSIFIGISLISFIFLCGFFYIPLICFPRTIFSGLETTLLPMLLYFVFYEIIRYSMGIYTAESLFTLFQIFTDLIGLIFSLFLPLILFYIGQRISEWENVLKRGKYVGLIHCGLLISSISGLFINTATSYPHHNGSGIIWNIDYGYPLVWLHFTSSYPFGGRIVWLNFTINSIFWIITTFLVFFLVGYIVNKSRSMRKVNNHS